MKSTSDTSNKKKLVRILIAVILFLVLVTVGIIVYANLKPDSNKENSTEITSEELASNTDIASNTDTSTELSTEVTTEEITEEVTTESTTEESSVTTESSSNDYVPPTTQAETTEDTTPTTEEEKTPVHTCSYTVVENVAPTCTTDGYVKEQCSCGKTRTTTTDAHGHSWVTTTETIHHDEVVEQVRMVVFSDGYEMVYTTGEAIDAYIKKCALEKGYMPSYTICDRFVVVQEAYDEVITTTTCSHCGCPQ